MYKKARLHRSHHTNNDDGSGNTRNLTPQNLYSGVAGKVQPLCCTMTPAEYAPALQHSSTDLPFDKAARKPPTYASPAPLVSTNFSFGNGVIAYSFVNPFTATTVGSAPCVPC